MGSCMSCKAGKEAYAYTTTPAVHTYPHYKSIGHKGFMACRKNESKPLVKRNVPYTRGQATLFGFKRRPATAPGSTATPLLDNAPAAASAPLSNRASHEELNNLSPISSSKSTPKLARPKKDVDGNNSVRTNRFGFRSSTPLAITNKVGDCNFNVLPAAHVINNQHVENQNLAVTDKPRAKGGGKVPLPKTRDVGVPAPESTGDPPRNKNKTNAAKQEVSNEAAQATRFTLQTTHLPKLQYPVRLSSVDVDVRNASKIAKTAANNSTRRGVQGFVEESSSKEGSVNDDSGIGSHQSTGMSNGETDTLHGVEILDSSPTFGYRRNRNMQKPRTLEMVVNGQCFDLRDLKDEDSSDPNVITEISVIPLEQSTSKAVRPTPQTGIPKTAIPQTGIPQTGIARGIVQERSRMYRQQVTASSPNNVRQENLRSRSSGDRSNSERPFRIEGEEKVFRDSSNSEKSLLGKGLITPGSMEGEDWGHGEAMAEEFSSSSDDGANHCSFSLSSTSLKTNIPVTAPIIEPNPRPVILRIEDHRFAAFAAATSTNMIEDEKSPVDSLISSPPSSSADDISEGEQQKSLLADDGKKGPSSGSPPEDAAAQRNSNSLSPESPGTPTNASNSLSLSEGRDFLIDDEIADQPGLTFDDGGPTVSRDLVTSSAGCSSLVLSATDNVTLVDSPPKSGLCPAVANTDGSPSPARSSRINRTASVDTLSPCESIASDDLMLDFERSERSEFDGTAESHLDGSVPGGLHTLDESSADTSDDPVKEWSVTASSLIKEAGLVTGRSRLLRPRTSSGGGAAAPDSPQPRAATAATTAAGDARARALGSPLRPASRPQTNSSESDDGGLYLDRHTYLSICQDIVNHKTMLLKLMRHLQKDQENSVRAETLNPFDSSLKNGLFYNLASTDVPAGETEDGRNPNIVEEVADLRRQVVFLQQQLEEKEHTIQLLQIQMVKYSGAEGNKTVEKETCNAATQTDRIRPVSAGPSLLQSLPSDNNGRPLVSLTDTWSQAQKGGMGGSNPALGKSVSRLPSARPWKRSNAAATEPTCLHASARKPHALSLSNSVLSPKLISTAAASSAAVSLPSPVSSIDKHTLIAK